jgi:ABC-type phosphate/phosphonate transport system substrate-binding protein
LVFETQEPLPAFSSLTPARRVLWVCLSLVAVAGLIWCCVSAYHAQPLPSATLTKLLDGSLPSSATDCVQRRVAPLRGGQN